MKISVCMMLVFVTVVGLFAGCLNGENGSAERYAPVTDLSGTWGERSEPVPFAGRIDTFTVEGSSVQMRSYVWSDVVLCIGEGECNQTTGMRYFSGHSVLEDGLLVFRIVPSDSAYAQIPGADTADYTLVAEGQDLRRGKLKLRRHERSFIFDRI